MIRFHHRIKTHGRWRIRPAGPQTYLWRSPHGYYFQVDPTGTHRLTPQAGQLLWDHCAHPTPDAATRDPLPDRPHGLAPPSPMEVELIRTVHTMTTPHPTPAERRTCQRPRRVAATQLLGGYGDVRSNPARCVALTANVFVV